LALSGDRRLGPEVKKKDTLLLSSNGTEKPRIVQTKCQIARKDILEFRKG